MEEDGWRLTHLGRLLGHAMRRFDERVLHLMAHNVDVPLALSNLAARASRGSASRVVRFTPTGLLWLQAFKDAVAQAEREFRQEVGPDVATVVAIGLEAYAGGSD